MSDSQLTKETLTVLSAHGRPIEISIDKDGDLCIDHDFGDCSCVWVHSDQIPALRDWLNRVSQ